MNRTTRHNSRFAPAPKVVAALVAFATLVTMGTVNADRVSAASSIALVRDIKIGAGSAAPLNLTAVGDLLFFTAKDAKGRELWKSDGTVAGTVRLRDIRTGSKSSAPDLLTAVGSNLFFVADDGIHGRELWKSDGTAAGTMMVEDIVPTSEGDLTSLINVNGTLFFFRDMLSQELWKSDGTAAGTSLVKLVNPDESTYGLVLLLVEGDSLYFQAHGVWKSDGTPAGTALVDFTDNAQWMISLNGVYYFSHYDAAYRAELWKSDGTVEGTELVKDLNTYPCTDGCDGTYSSEPSKPVVMNGTMYFTAYDSEFITYLWRSDGTEAGTLPLAADAGYDMVTLGNKLLFGGDAPSDVDYELMRSDGTEAGTRLVKRIAPKGSYFGSYPHDLTRVGDRVYFAACTASNPFGYDAECELYRTDGTKAGTRRVLDINPSAESDPRNLTAVGGSLYFTADDGVHGRELWRVGP